MADSFTFHILPTEVADAPFVSKIGSDAFLVDRRKISINHNKSVVAYILIILYRNPDEKYWSKAL